MSCGFSIEEFIYLPLSFFKDIKKFLNKIKFTKIYGHTHEWATHQLHPSGYLWERGGAEISSQGNSNCISCLYQGKRSEENITFLYLQTRGSKVATKLFLLFHV